MTIGLVYLRPRRVVCYRTYGPFPESAPKAWAYVLNWMDKLGVRNEVACGYGVAREDPDQPPARQHRYDACFERPPSIGEHLLADLQTRDLPGGAYARKRYVGPLDGISDAMREMRATWIPKHGLCADPARPRVEIYLDDPDKVAAEKLRADLCLPVAVEGLSKVA